MISQQKAQSRAVKHVSLERILFITFFTSSC